jgi:hypothetical protein
MATHAQKEGYKEAFLKLHIIGRGHNYAEEKIIVQ